MNRKQWSYGQGRRSSAPKRFSAALPETEDRNKNGDGKKSFIPRPTSVSSRSSSVEREGLQSSSRSTQKFVRSTSVERIGDENIKSSGRSRSTESAFTPKHLMKSGCRNTVSVQRTVRKDTRPLSDRAFQIAELAKVEEYLVRKEIITPGPSLSNSMTLKLFVHIMNSLLGVLFWKQHLTLSNYCELIPLLMRKLKYPGNITRSWLVTANSSHSWHNVLGLLSWLVDLLNLVPSDLKYNAEDDEESENVLDCEKAKKLFEFTTQRYIEWSENDMPVRNEEDDKFFDDIIEANMKPLKDNLESITKEVQELENLISGDENSEEYSSEQMFKAVKTDLEKRKSARKAFKEELQTLRIELDKIKSKIQALLSENAELKQSMVENECSNSFNADDVAKLQSEAVSLRNIIKVRDPQLTDINNQCFSLDLTNARFQGKLDKIRLEREAILRECTSQNINAEEFQLSLKYGNEDNPRILDKYLANIKRVKVRLDNVLKEYLEKENSYKMQRNEAEEKIKSCEHDLEKKQTMIKQRELMLAELKSKSVDRQSQIRKRKEECSKLEEKQILLKHNEESLSGSLTDLQEELKVCDETFEEQEAKYLRILERMCEALQNHVRKFRELVSTVGD